MADERLLSARRALLDAIYAIHAGDGQIRIDAQLAENLEKAWTDYDTSVLAAAERNRTQSLADTARLRDDRDALAAENGRLRHRLELMADGWHRMLQHEMENGHDFDTCTDLACIQNREALTGRADGEA